jgi:hypothetical protein
MFTDIVRRRGRTVIGTEVPSSGDFVDGAAAGLGATSEREGPTAMRVVTNDPWHYAAR